MIDIACGKHETIDTGSVQAGKCTPGLGVMCLVTGMNDELHPAQVILSEAYQPCSVWMTASNESFHGINFWKQRCPTLPHGHLTIQTLHGAIIPYTRNQSHPPRTTSFESTTIMVTTKKAHVRKER